MARRFDEPAEVLELLAQLVVLGDHGSGRDLERALAGGEVLAERGVVPPRLAGLVEIAPIP